MSVFHAKWRRAAAAAGAVVMLAGAEEPTSVTQPSVPQWRMAWCWSEPDEAPAEKIAKVKDLGFNAFAPALPGREQALLAACKQAGVECFMPVYGDAATSFKYAGLKAPEQVMLPREKQALAEQQRDPEKKGKYQFGGEPVYEGEIYWNAMLCPNAPETEAVVKAQIENAAAAGFDGIAFDYFGYQNYRGCYCPSCLAKFEGFFERHPELSEEDAFARFAEDSLVNLINGAVAFARSRKPGIKTACHVYPHFAPNPFYGNRLAVDYCGVTAVWFFHPHWGEEKIKACAARIVGKQSEHNKTSLGAPFIGVYARDVPAPSRKSASRVAAELEFVSAAAPRAVQMAELGHLLADEAIAAAIKQFFRPSKAGEPR